MRISFAVRHGQHLVQSEVRQFGGGGLFAPDLVALHQHGLELSCAGRHGHCMQCAYSRIANRHGRLRTAAGCGIYGQQNAVRFGVERLRLQRRSCVGDGIQDAAGGCHRFVCRGQDHGHERHLFFDHVAGQGASDRKRRGCGRNDHKRQQLHPLRDARHLHVGQGDEAHRIHVAERICIERERRRCAVRNA